MVLQRKIEISGPVNHAVLFNCTHFQLKLYLRSQSAENSAPLPLAVQTNEIWYGFVG
jgi:hypothetical protein